MKEKKKFFALLLIAMMLLSMQVAFSATTPVLKLTLLRYEPTPANPGEYITAYIQVENIGDAQAKNVRLTFQESYPFSVEDESEREEVIGKLEVGQIYIAEMRIRIDVDAVSGANDLKFLATDDYLNNAASKIEKIFKVNILSRDAELEIERVEVSPAELGPGSQGKIIITLKNNDDSTLSDVKSSLSLFSLTNGQTVDLPFAVRDSVTEKTVGNIAAGVERQIQYDIVTYPTILPGIYKLPIVFTYFDSTGRNFTNTKFVTLNINPTTDVYMTIDSTQITNEATSGAVTIKVVNKGLGDIKLANLRIGSHESFDLLSTSSQNYVGQIDSDDYQTADFTINAKQEKVILPVTLTFKDSLNNEHEITENLEFTQRPSQNGKGGSGFVIILLIAVVIIGGAIYYFRRRGRK